MWPAIAFGYFEALLHIADVSKFDVEEARLNSMNNLLNLAGFSEDVYIDFADEAYELLRKLGASLQVGNGATLLLEAFNDMGVSMAIITYVKVRARACHRPDDCTNTNSSLPVLGSSRARMSIKTTSRQTSRATARRTSKLPSVKSTTWPLRRSQKHSSSQPASAWRSSTWIVQWATRSMPTQSRSR